MSDLIPELKRHSASALNNFIENRTGWFVDKILSERGPGNGYMFRGTAVEHGINVWLEKDASLDECIAEAIKKFNDEALGASGSEIFDCRQSIAPCVKRGIESFKNGYLSKHEKPTMQQTIEFTFKGCKKPVFGYMDYLFDGEFVVDNKVVSRTPSSLKQAYVLQGSIYRKATGLPVEFHFITPPMKTKGSDVKIIRLTDEEYDFGLRLAHRACLAIENIFDNIHRLDYDLLMSLFFINPDSFYNEKEMAIMLNKFNL